MGPVRSMKGRAAERIEKCREKVEKTLTKAGMDELHTDKYTVTKRRQSRAVCSKKDLPEAIFDRYKRISEFTVLTFRAHKGKRSPAAMKAKRSNKKGDAAAGSAAAPPKPKAA